MKDRVNAKLLIMFITTTIGILRARLTLYPNVKNSANVTRLVSEVLAFSSYYCYCFKLMVSCHPVFRLVSRGHTMVTVALDRWTMWLVLSTSFDMNMCQQEPHLNNVTCISFQVAGLHNSKLNTIGTVRYSRYLFLVQQYSTNNLDRANLRFVLLTIHCSIAGAVCIDFLLWMVVIEDLNVNDFVRGCDIAKL